MLCFAQKGFAQTNYFQGKLTYKLSFEMMTEDDAFNKAVVEKTREKIGYIDSVVVFIKDKHFRTELRGQIFTQYFQYVPSEHLVYQYLSTNDYVFIYPGDYEPFPSESDNLKIVYDSTITLINDLPCQSYSIEDRGAKTVFFYSENLRSDSPILKSKYTTNFLRNYNEIDFIPVKTTAITPFFTINYELINMEPYNIPMNVFQLPEVGKTHKKMQRMLKRTPIKVRKIKQ